MTICLIATSGNLKHRKQFYTQIFIIEKAVQSQILCKHQNRCKTESKYIVAAAALSDAAYLHNNTDGA